jgi:bifunctional polynucleotide phosphatase/kinase
MNNFTWEINDDFIFGIKKFKNKNEITKINLFDLDSTLIKTKSGRVFPKDKHDWQLLYTKVSSILNNNKFLNGIVSNQSGLKTKEKIKDWIYKLDNICENNNISFVFASIGHNKYRKPMCHSWIYIKNILKQKKIDIDILENNKVTYIGDACGRKNDFSDTDIKFAKNCGLKFKTPEIFFKPPNYKNSDKIANISYPNLKYYDPSFLDKLLTKINAKIINKNKVLIMFIGFQASGKSFLRKFLIKNLNNFKYFNNDDIINYKKDKDNKDYKHLIHDPVDQNKIIDDNTNINTIKRLSQLNKFNDYYKIGISFDLNDDVLSHLNHLRMYEFNKKLIPKVAYNVIKKNCDKTKFNEKFDVFIKINKLFDDYKNKTKLKYYF